MNCIYINLFTLIILCVSGIKVSGQTNDQTSPTHFPNVDNPTKQFQQTTDTMHGNGKTVVPGVDPGTYLYNNADSLATGSPVPKKKKKKGA